MKIKAVLFDYDGTLRDSRSLIYASLEHTFTEHGLPAPTKDELAPHIHHHSFVHEALAPEVPYDDFEGVYRDKVNELMPTVKLYDGAEELLHKLDQADYKLGLVTAAKDAAKNLEDLGVAQLFDVVISAKDITKHKPDPEGILLAVERLGIEPGEAVYVGDMMTDMYAAQAAGLKACIGVTIGMANRRELETSQADYIIDSLAELPPILQKLAA